MIEEKIIPLYIPYPDSNEERLVRVFIPEHEAGETFPVIYMTDGQNLFEDNHVEFGCWYTRETIRDEKKATGKAAIIVGIHNDGDPMERTNELTPLTIGELACPEELKLQITPQGEIFDDFVVNRVMPIIEKDFPVELGRNATAICGSSSGGLQAFFTALNHPDLFCAAGVLSPAFVIYTPEDTRDWIHSKLQPVLPYLYIYSGAGDDQEKLIYQSTEWTYEILEECYPPEKLNEVILFEMPHHETAWEQIFKDFLHIYLERRAEF